MNFYHFFGRVLRFVMAGVLLLTVGIYIHESTFDSKIVDVVKNVEGEYSIQISEIDVKLALNDSTLMLKVDA